MINKFNEFFNNDLSGFIIKNTNNSPPYIIKSFNTYNNDFLPHDNLLLVNDILNDIKFSIINNKCNNIIYNDDITISQEFDSLYKSFISLSNFNNTIPSGDLINLFDKDSYSCEYDCSSCGKINPKFNKISPSNKIIIDKCLKKTNDMLLLQPKILNLYYFIKENCK